MVDMPAFVLVVTRALEHVGGFVLGGGVAVVGVVVVVVVVFLCGAGDVAGGGGDGDGVGGEGEGDEEGEGGELHCCGWEKVTEKWDVKKRWRKVIKDCIGEKKMMSNQEVKKKLLRPAQ